MSVEKYQITKTIGFKLLPVSCPAMQNEVAGLKQFDELKQKELLEELARKLEEFQTKLDLFIWEKGKQDRHAKRLLNNHKIKYQWLRTYAKDPFYDFLSKQNNPPRIYALKDIAFFEEVIKNWQDRWNHELQNLKSLTSRPQYNKAPKSEYALVIKTFRKRDMIPFAKALLEYIKNSKKETDDFKKELESLISVIDEQVLNCEKYLLPAQSMGFEISRANFNYYAVNKKPKDFKDELEKLQNEKLNIDAYKEDQILRKYSKELCLEQVQDIDALYSAIKDFKEKQKRFFEDDIHKGLSKENLKQGYKIFNITSDKPNVELQKYIDATKKIEGLSVQKEKEHSQANKDELQKQISVLRTKRSKFFQCGHHDYKTICKVGSGVFFKIAMKRGQIVAKEKAIKQAKIQAERTRYWALLLEEDGKHCIALLNREKMKEAKKYIEETEKNLVDGVDSYKCIYFKSLTLYALNKIIFNGAGQKLNNDLENELRMYVNNDKNFGRHSVKSYTQDKQVQFYQTVLKTKYINMAFDLKDFDLEHVLNSCFKIMDEFELALESICYKIFVFLSQEIKEKLIRDFSADIFEITSYDLSRQITSKVKDHTALWKKFWQKSNADCGYTLRLNPEIRISWREPKQNRIDKYGVDSKKNNRYLHEQYTLFTTMVTNAPAKYTDFSFKKPEEIKAHVESFNQNINKIYSDRENICFYGIDRGVAELATLFVGKFKARNGDPDCCLHEELNFEVYSLKDEYITADSKVYKNISYYINDEAYFTRKQVSSINLTMAKLINGKIIENGDIQSYLKLKELAARRKLLKLKAQVVLADDCLYLDGKKNICINAINREDVKTEKIYYFKDELSLVAPEKNIMADLQRYLNNEKELLLIDSIMRHRTAIAANMVGIINFLTEKYPGYVVLENLLGGSNLLKSEDSNMRFLECGLYRKFQSKGIVPVNLKQAIFLREKTAGENLLNQIGNILFVSETNTSQTCPQCGTINKKSEVRDTEKFVRHVFKCTACAFDTSDSNVYLGLNSPDKVAAFNIAENGFYSRQL
jgi:predicted RNA-binding Zn-ribbon protein involved in translation (DUF1610 family)